MARSCITLVIMRGGTGRIKELGTWLLILNSRCLGFNLIDFETAFVFVLSFLWPEDMMKPKGTDHHEGDEDIGNDEKSCHNAADDFNGFAGESLPYCKGGSDERSVGEDEGVPSHGEYEPVVSYNGEVCEHGDEEEEDRKAGNSVNKPSDRLNVD